MDSARVHGLGDTKLTTGFDLVRLERTSRCWLAQILIITRASETLTLNRPSDFCVLGGEWIRTWIPNTMERRTFISANCRIEFPFPRQFSKVDALRLVSSQAVTANGRTGGDLQTL